MNIGLIITMGGLTLGGAILESILNKTGKADEAKMVSITTTSMLAATTVGCAIKALVELGKLK